jgi:hypothetical protein
MLTLGGYMQTYLIIVQVADQKSYIKLVEDKEDGIVIRFTNKMNASIFSEEQMMGYIPMIKSQQHVFLNDNTAYISHNLRIYAEKYAEITLQ